MRETNLGKSGRKDAIAKLLKIKERESEMVFLESVNEETQRI